MTVDQLLDVLAFLLAVPVIAYVIGAVVHIYIDQVHGKRLKDEFFATTKRDIVDPAIAGIRADIQQLRSSIDAIKIPDLAPLQASIDAIKIDPADLPIGEEFERFLDSERGRAWSVELAEVAADQITSTMTAKASAAAGIMARTAQSKIIQLIDAQVDFGNPIMNGIWMMFPRPQKAAFFNRLAQILRRTGYAVIPVDSDTPPQILDAELVNSTPELQGGGENANLYP
jgi:hypothetical protein